MRVASFLRRIILSYVAFWLYLTLPHFLLNGKIFGKKLLNIKRVLILPTTDA
jgi:hypothetical protein